MSLPHMSRIETISFLEQTDTGHMCVDRRLEEAYVHEVMLCLEMMSIPEEFSALEYL
jgi:hypothetical protein